MLDGYLVIQKLGMYTNFGLVWIIEDMQTSELTYALF